MIELDLLVIRMERLNIPELKKVLQYLGVSSAGTKNDLLARLDAVLVEQNKNLEGIMAEANACMRDSVLKTTNEQCTGEVLSVVRDQSGETEKRPERGRSGEEDEVTPDDSMSQVSEVNKGRSDGRSGVSKNRDGLADTERAPGGLLNLLTAGRKSNSVVSRVSRAGSRMSNISALERKRELEVQLAVRAKMDGKLEQIERLKEENRQREASMQAKIRALEREAHNEALRTEAKAWAEFEALDMGVGQKNEVRIEEPVFRESCKGTSSRVGRPITEQGKWRAARGKLNNEGSMRKGGKWLDTVDNEDGFGGGGLTETFLRELTASNMRIRMPKHEIECFSGDATQYMIFKGSIEEIMQAGSLSYVEKLHYLYQYTRGEPRELVKAALCMEPEKGYEEIWKWYEDKYGAPERIGAEFIDKLLAHPHVARDDVEGLKSFAVALRLTKNVVDRIPYGQSELGHPKTIRALVAKLSYGLQERWRRLYTTRIEVGDSVRFEDLVEFVEREVRMDSNPLYGKQAMEKASVDQFGRVSQARRRVAVNTISYESDDGEKYNGTGRETNAKQCVCCDGVHQLAFCAIFKRMSCDQRWQLVKNKQVCFICLRGGHRGSNCPLAKQCSSCKRYHHDLLHQDRGVGNQSRLGIDRGNSQKEGRWNFGGRDDSVTEINNGRTSYPVSSTNYRERETIEPRVVISRVCAIDGTVIGGMAVLPVVIRGESGTDAITAAFMDQGSAVSFCTYKLLDKLGIGVDQTGRVSLWTETMHGSKSERVALVTGLMVRGREEREWVALPPVYVVERIPINENDAMRAGDVKSWSHLQDLIVEYEDEIGLMIGSNAVGALEPLETRAAPVVGDPYAVRTRLGWSVMGLIGSSKSRRVAAHRVRLDYQEIKVLINEAFESGFEGLHEERRGLSQEDERWYDIVERGCKKVDGHYEIPLPLRGPIETLPASKFSAIKRAEGLRRKFRRDDDLNRMYSEGVKEMIDKGYAEKVHGGEGVWYLPHFAVHHPAKPNKVRVVFDCAAKVRGTSLNDILLSGPDLATLLVDVLLRFRKGKYAFTADVNAMFHQVRVPKEQRNLFRFFWWDNDGTIGQMKEHRMAVHLFGACSSPSIANYALKRVADDVKDDDKSEVKQVLRENFYVDDCLVAHNDPVILQTIARDLQGMCEQGGFLLRKFSSNVEGIQSEMGETTNVSESETVLGIVWDKLEDELGIVAMSSDSEVRTKRQLLSLIAKIYDPLGIVAPTVLQGRLLFQSIIRRDGVGEWDAVLTEVDQEKVREWKTSLTEVGKRRIPRSVIVNGQVQSIQLHVFGDACESGHAAVAYSRVMMKSGKVHCIFIMGKAKVNPCKYVSVPRLELVASTLVARIRHKLTGTLGIEFNKTFLWTDSQTVLRYLRNEKDRYHCFVANRVTEIRRKTDVRDWHYVETKSNPADDGSRGNCSIRWRAGPSFLKLNESEWPHAEIDIDDDICDQEVKVVSTIRVRTDTNIIAIILERYSDWKRLSRAVAWLGPLRTIHRKAKRFDN